jgi:hypothetical protein
MLLKTKRCLFAILLALLLIAGGASAAWAYPRGEPDRRVQTSPSPIPLQFPTPTATTGPPTETPTRTATSAGRPYVEAISNETNIRAQPDIGADRVGLIYPGTTYAVIGKRFEWYLIEFPNSPTGTAWVHNSVVKIFGDETQIPEMELEDVATIDPAFLNAQATAAVISATPGAVLTLTAEALITPTGIFTPEPGAAATLIPGQPVPTFTFPPYTPTPLVIPRTNPNTETGSGLPPLLPILALGALGLMGLLVAFMRRL